MLNFFQTKNVLGILLADSFFCVSFGAACSSHAAQCFDLYFRHSHRMIFKDFLLLTTVNKELAKKCHSKCIKPIFEGGCQCPVVDTDLRIGNDEGLFWKSCYNISLKPSEAALRKLKSSL